MPEKNTVTIKVSQIKENPLNMRSMDLDQIRILAYDIDTYGLMQPLAVYEDDDGRYTLLSGHRRLAALKQLGVKEVPCKVFPKPADEFEEQEILTSANISRRKPSELVDELKRAEQAWNTMFKENRDRHVERLKAQFIKEHQSVPKYIEDPDLYVHNNFRPKFEYIRSLTGFDLSNSTIKEQLKKAVPEEAGPNMDGISEAEDEEDAKSEKKEKKEKEITLKDIAKAASTLRGMIMGFVVDDMMVREELNILDENLNDLLMLILDD